MFSAFFFLSAKVIETGLFPRKFCPRRFLFQWKMFHQKFPGKGWEEASGEREGTGMGEAPGDAWSPWEVREVQSSHAAPGNPCKTCCPHAGYFTRSIQHVSVTLFMQDSLGVSSEQEDLLMSW